MSGRKASRISTWCSGESSRCWPCWLVCMSRRGRSSPKRSCEARSSLRYRRLRPVLADSSRRRKISFPSRRKAASTNAFSRPGRIRSVAMRSPRMKSSARRIKDFPAPDSPVSTLRPGWNSSSTSSMRARFLMRSVSSMVFCVRVCGETAVAPAGYRNLIALPEGQGNCGEERPERMSANQSARSNSSPKAGWADSFFQEP